MARIIGIDLGTTNSVVAVMEGGEPTVIPSREGERLVPSVVAVNKNHERLTGRPARNQSVVNPENTVFSIKRFMGRKFSDPQVQKAVSRMPYKVTEAPNGDVRVMMDGREYSPPEISAMILGKLKADAEAYLGETITQAVITVPAYFNDAQRNATKDAGKIAGLEVLRIINEPTASSLAYGLDKKRATKSLRSTILAAEPSISPFWTLAKASSRWNLPMAIPSWAATTLTSELSITWPVSSSARNGIDLRRDRQALQRLKEGAEKAKIELSSTVQSEINLPYITADASGPKHLVINLTRAKLEQLTGDLIERSLGPVRQALKDAGKQPSQINEVVLVGGMTRMPAVQEAVRKLFGKDPHKGVNPDEVVAVGAAIQAGVLGGEVKDILLLDVTPLTLSVETLGSVATPLIERNTTIPTRKSQIFSTAGDSQTQVEIHVLQGERPMAADNKSLGKFNLDGIPPAPRGVPQIEVTFDIDANGIIKVTASDKATGRSQHITITASSGLRDDEVERMRKDAEAHAEEDKQRKELVEARNQADNTVYSAEKVLHDLGDKVPADLRKSVEERISKVREVMNGNDLETIRRLTEELSEELQKVGSAAYQQAPSEPAPEQPGNQGDGPSGPDENVVDGEFRNA